MLNVENLKVGHMYKGYKEICNIFGENIKGGKSKQLQVRDWKRYFDWIEHTRYKWEVIKVYEHVKEKEDGRKNNVGGNNNIFSDHMDYLILEQIKNEGNIEGTLRQIANCFGMVNGEWGEVWGDIDGFAEELGIDSWYMLDFYVNVKSQIYNIIKSSFTRLQKQGCIQYDITTFAKYVNGKTWILSNEQKQQYEEIEEEVLKLMGYSKKSQVISSGKWKEFYEQLSLVVISKMNILYTFDSYCAVVPMGIDDHMLEERLFELEEKYGYEFDHKKALNEKLYDKITDNAVKRHMKAKMKTYKLDDCFVDCETRNVIANKRAMEKYIDTYRKCVDYFIKINKN